MSNYQIALQSKGLNECNVARILQSVDFGTDSDVYMEQLKNEAVQAAHDGPIKSEGKVSCRKKKEEALKPTEYLLKATNKRLKTFKWNGVSEETGRYAVMFQDRNELKLILCDHWYKFTRCQETAPSTPAKELAVLSKKERERLRELQVVRQNLENESEGLDEGPPKRTRRKLASDEEEAAREGLDFDEEFTDDEMSKASSKESSYNSPMPKVTSLSISSQKIQLVPHSDSDFGNSGCHSDIGLRLSDEELRPSPVIYKRSDVGDSKRSHGITLKERVAECRARFKDSQ